ncbi:MAG: hypothetical protein M3Z64_12550 [Verrucomicrobiota bacterium]|nr:hypothetical protein [Verrucomicrobiota bacterium]
MQDPNEKIERSLLKIVGWTLGIIILLSIAGVAGARSFRSWQQRRLVAQANALVNEGDLKRASLDVRRVLQLNPDNADGCRVMARLAEKAGSRTAVDWRRRVMDLGAAKVDDLILLARDGIRYEDRAAADLAISKLPEEAKSRADYHSLLAEVALQQRNGLEMERQLSEALRLDPENKEYVMRLAALRLSASDPSIREAGRQTLLELQKEPTLRRQATLHLTEDALRRKEFTEALALAREVDALPDKTFADRLVVLSALQAAQDPGFGALLTDLQNTAADDGERASAVVTWMNVHAMPREAVDWASKLSPSAMGRLLPIALADSYVALSDWAGLERLVKTGNWGPVDFLRSALAARALRELGNEVESAGQWREAIRKVAANPRQIFLLVETVQRWRWRAEEIELLWLAAKDPVKGDEALRSLYVYFLKNGDTQNLYRVLVHRYEAHPADLDVQNNLAQVSLLLNADTARAQRLARDLFEKDSKNPAYVSTYAFALFAKGDTKNALATMEKLSDAERRQPQIAGYYGMILAETGDRARASELLDLAQSTNLLPEEKALMEKARRAVAQR